MMEGTSSQTPVPSTSNAITPASLEIRFRSAADVITASPDTTATTFRLGDFSLELLEKVSCSMFYHVETPVSFVRFPMSL